jgi:RNA polymerase sigma-70 factor, ECF subfamily
MTQPRFVQPAAAPGPSGTDAEAMFDALVREHYARLCQFALDLVGSRADAEEVVQDVFTSVWLQWPGTRPKDPIAYLYGAVRRASASRHRKAFVREAWLRAEATVDRLERTVADEYEERSILAALARAIDRLPQRCRLVFTMSREQDLTYNEIARALGISVKTVETQMGRALNALRRALAPHLS